MLKTIFVKCDTSTKCQHNNDKIWFPTLYPFPFGIKRGISWQVVRLMLTHMQYMLHFNRCIELHCAFPHHSLIRLIFRVWLLTKYYLYLPSSFLNFQRIKSTSNFPHACKSHRKFNRRLRSSFSPYFEITKIITWVHLLYCILSCCAEYLHHINSA